MVREKVAVTIDAQLLREIDGWVAAGDFPSRSQVIQTALTRLREERKAHGTLLGELAKLNPREEQVLADEFLKAEVSWPQS